jgi:hypothetical protein
MRWHKREREKQPAADRAAPHFAEPKPAARDVVARTEERDRRLEASYQRDLTATFFGDPPPGFRSHASAPVTDTSAAIVASPASPRHRWGEPLRFTDSTERPCLWCTLRKVTMHPPRGNPYRMWKYGQTGSPFKSDLTPRCDPGESHG